MMGTTCLLAGRAEDKLDSDYTKGMMKKRQDSPAMLNRVTMKSSTKMDLEAKEDWLEKMALKFKFYQLNEAREAESIWVRK